MCAAYIDAFPPLTCPLSFAVVLVGLPSPENRNMEVFDLISRNLNEVRGAIIGGMGAGGCLGGAGAQLQCPDPIAVARWCCPLPSVPFQALVAAGLPSTLVLCPDLRICGGRPLAELNSQVIDWGCAFP